MVIGTSFSRHSLEKRSSYDWTRQLLSDRKERLLTSGMGMPLYAQVFG